MTPASLDITIYKGITFGPLVITCKDSSNVVVDLTGWTPFAEVRKAPGYPVVFNLAPSITDAVHGQVTILRTDEQTFALPTDNYQWDFILQKPTGERLGPYISGACAIKGVITHPAE